MSAQNIRHFTRQKGALKDSPRTEKGPEGWRRYTFASDYDVDRTSSYYRSKRYVTAPLRDFWHWYACLPAGERHYYELLHPNVPSKMYFDLDALMLDSNRRKLKYVRSRVVSDIRAFFKQLLGTKEGECEVIKLLHLSRSSSSTRKSSAAIVEECAQRVLLLDASNDKKFSLHITFPDFVAKNPFHCGALMRRLECWLVDKYGQDPAKNPYYVRTGEGDSDEHELVIDRGVYTTYRVMRLPWSSKARQGRFLYPMREGDRELSKQLNFETFVDSLIQHTVRMSCDPKRGGIMLDGGPRVPVLFCVCEVRTPQAVEDTQKYPSTAEWIDPKSAGRRIWHLSRSTMQALLMHTYSGVGQSQSRVRSSESSSSSSSAPRRRIERVTDSTVTGVANILIGQFGVDKNSRPSASITTKRRQLEQSIFSISRSLVISMGAPTWWSEFSPPEFYDSEAASQINPIRGTVRISPKAVRHCESIGAEHKSNNVYFFIDANGSRGAGHIRQVCHNGCRSTRQCYRRPRSDEDVGRMRVLRAKLQQLMALSYQGTLDLPASITNHQTVLARHCIRVLVSSVNHFVDYAEMMTDPDRVVDETNQCALARRYIDSVAQSFHVKRQQLGSSTDSDVSSASECDDQLFRTTSNFGANDSIDHFDRLWQSACDTYEDAAQQVGVVETLCSTVLLYSIAKLPEERAKRVGALYAMYRGWLVRRLWALPMRNASIWNSDLAAMAADIKAWYTIFQSSGVEHVEHDDPTSERMIVYKHASRIEKRYATAFGRYRRRLGADDYESSFVAQSTTHLFIHKASSMLKQFLNFDC